MMQMYYSNKSSLAPKWLVFIALFFLLALRSDARLLVVGPDFEIDDLFEQGYYPRRASGNDFYILCNDISLSFGDHWFFQLPPGRLVFGFNYDNRLNYLNYHGGQILKGKDAKNWLEKSADIIGSEIVYHQAAYHNADTQPIEKFWEDVSASSFWDEKGFKFTVSLKQYGAGSSDAEIFTPSLYVNRVRSRVDKRKDFKQRLEGRKIVPSAQWSHFDLKNVFETSSHPQHFLLSNFDKNGSYQDAIFRGGKANDAFDSSTVEKSQKNDQPKFFLFLTKIAVCLVFLLLSVLISRWLSKKRNLKH